MTDHVLLSDISNGLYLKLALAPRGERPGETTHYACDGLDAFKASIAEFLEVQGSPPLSGAAISAAGWERNGLVQLPNHGFSIERNEMRELLGIQRINIVNDFVAKALAIPRLETGEFEKICGGEPVAEQVIAVIGPHNGLGVAALAPDGMGSWTAMPSEGGHSDLAPVNAREAGVLAFLTQKYGHVSRERVVSIPALSDIWQALASLEGEPQSAPSPEEVIAMASAGDERSLEAIHLSMGWFAAMASDIALILGARGGVYLAGDLLDMIGDLFDVAAFEARYRDKGRLSDYVSDIPVFRVKAADLEVIGLATLFD